MRPKIEKISPPGAFFKLKLKTVSSFPFFLSSCLPKVFLYIFFTIFLQRDEKKSGTRPGQCHRGFYFRLTLHFRMQQLTCGEVHW